MAGLFIKLDYDWLRDPKVRNFRREGGKAALVDLVQLFILMSRNHGRVDLNDRGQLEDAVDTLGMKEPRMMNFLALAADCGIIDKELWDGARVVSSNRAVKDANIRRSRASAGRNGGIVSGESRRAKGDG